MQPAFIPPAGYFRLFGAADIFVVLDNVQFNRRWYTHRQQLTKWDGTKDWFTLPLKKGSRDTTMICDLEWAADAKERMDEEERLFPIFEKTTLIGPQWFTFKPMVFILGIMDECVQRLGMKFPEMHIASQLDIPANLHGQDRIIAICKSLGATEYINSPGGKDLYDTGSFEKEGIKLTFLPDYPNNDSVFERLANEDPEDIKKEIYANL